MTQSKRDNNNLEKHIREHFVFSFIYLIAALPIYILLFCEGYILQNSKEIFPTFLWCFASGLLGFVFYIWFKIPQMKRGKSPNESPLPTYIYYYPFVLFVTSSLTVSFLSLLSNLLGKYYYFALFSISTLFGLYIDDPLGIIGHLFGKKI